MYHIFYLNTFLNEAILLTFKLLNTNQYECLLSIRAIMEKQFGFWFLTCNFCLFSEPINMKTKKKKATKTKSDKYDRQNKLSAARQQKYRDSMTDEKKEEYRKKARERYQKRKNERKVKLITDLSAKEQKEEMERRFEEVP